MKREDRIIDYLEKQGISTTVEIAEALQLQRTNVSKILNQLVREEKVIKTTTRPVQYQLVANKQVKEENKSLVLTEHGPVFENITGYQGSMKNQIEQAKAAILYPPKGLNCLITGQTGTGKTLFVHTMFQFAKDEKIIADDLELTVFNCADYANNSELLMAHLFGYVKGAFTGADETTDGLIQQADGGMLFLDEVHRLPPEGQEMIFYFMDHGKYSRLGEVEKQHKANVRIVCATTEDPTSNLLSTFMRRIPITIQLPNFHDRPGSEQVELLKTMLRLESYRIDKQFVVTEDVAKALIGSVDYGNVGQLKSNVQLVCARGFLHNMGQEQIHLTLDMLTPQIKEGLLKLSENHQLQAKLAPYLEHEIVINPQKETSYLEQDAYELPYNLYQIIDDKATVLKEEGLSQSEINQFITTDINVHLKTFYQDKVHNVETNLEDIVDKEIVEMAKEMQLLLEQEGYPVQKHFIYAMSLHLSSFIKRMQSGDDIKEISPNLIAMVADYPEELELTMKLINFLEVNYQILVPKSEVYYLATLLVSLKTANNKGSNKIGVVVLAHGNATASSMVNTVNQLLQVDHIQAFDMPLEMKPSEAYAEIKNKIKSANNGSGVLVLADMGSLVTVGQKIAEELQIEVRTIDMVTTAMVLEAGRKTSLGSNLTLADIFQELRSFKGYSRTVETKQTADKKQAILTICASGVGTAERLKEVISKTIADRQIEIIPLSVLDLEQQLPKLKLEYDFLATIGVVNPNLNIPYLTIEEFLQPSGQKLLANLVQFTNEEQNVDDELIKLLEETYIFINARKILPLLEEYWYFLEENYFGLQEKSKLNLIVHMAGVIERAVQRTALDIDDNEAKKMYANKNFEVVQQANKLLMESLNIEIVEEEVYYILTLCDTQV